MKSACWRGGESVKMRLRPAWANVKSFELIHVFRSRRAPADKADWSESPTLPFH